MAESTGPSSQLLHQNEGTLHRDVIASRDSEPFEAKPFQVIVFFFPLAVPIGVPHGSTISLTRSERIPWLAEVQRFSQEGISPDPRNDDSNFVSIKVWRPRRWFSLPTEPMDDVFKVVHSVIGLGDSEVRPTPFSELEPQEFGATVIEAVTPLVSDGPEPFRKIVSEAFDRVLEELGTFLRAYALTTNHQQVRFPTLTNVFPTVLYSIRTESREGPYHWSHLQMLMVNDGRATIMTPPNDLDQEGAWLMMSRVVRYKAGDPLILFAELMFLAHRSFSVDGDYQAAVMSAHAAGEVLVNGLMLLLEWERGSRAAVVQARLEEEGLARRLRIYYGPLLGGDWNAERADSPVRAFSDVSKLRGRVAHAGYVPKLTEVRMTFDSLALFENFVKDRVVHCRATYPRTALMLLGEPGLRKRNAWNGAMLRFVDKHGIRITEWLDEYRQWLEGEPDQSEYT